MCWVDSEPCWCVVHADDRCLVGEVFVVNAAPAIILCIAVEEEEFSVGNAFNAIFARACIVC